MPASTTKTLVLNNFVKNIYISYVYSIVISKINYYGKDPLGAWEGVVIRSGRSYGRVAAVICQEKSLHLVQHIDIQSQYPLENRPKNHHNKRKI